MAVAVVAIAAAGLSGSAGATFPGSNGQIAFEGGDTSAFGPRDVIWSINPDGTNRAVLEGTDATFQNLRSGMVWAPDGRTLAYTTVQDPDESPDLFDIVVTGAHRGGTNSGRNLTGNAFDPSWSPDGSQLVYRCDSRTSNGSVVVDNDICVVNADGSNPHVLVQIPAVWVAWSPDGRHLAYSLEAGFGSSSTTGLYVADADGSNGVRIATDVSSGEWSPDSKQFLFTTTVGGVDYVTAMNVDGSDRHTIVPGYGATWSPDGKQIAFLTATGIQIANVDGSDEHPLIDAATGKPVAAVDLSWGVGSPPARRYPPTVTSRPTISGSAAVGSPLTAAVGTWNGDPPLTYAYQWQRCNSAGSGCVDIAGATSSTYTVDQADALSTLRVAVTATNGAGSATSGSDATGVVPSPAVRTPTTGTTAPRIRSARVSHAGSSVRLSLAVCSAKGGTLYVTEWNRRGTKAVDKERRTWSVAPKAACHTVVRTWRPRLRSGNWHVLALRMRAGTLWSPAVRVAFRAPRR